MDDDDLTVTSAAFILLCTLIKNSSKRRKIIQKTSKNVIRINSNSSVQLDDPKIKRRKTQYRTRKDDSDEEHPIVYEDYKITKAAFNDLLEKITEKIQKKDTRYRQSIKPNIRFLATLHFLTSGETYTKMRHSWKISKQSLSSLIPEVCDALVQTLQHNVKLPSDENEWLEVAKKFEQKFGIPNCIGCIDVRESIIPNWNNKSCGAMLTLLVIVDADGNFMYADTLYRAAKENEGEDDCEQLISTLKNHLNNIPEDHQIIAKSSKVPYVFVGNDSFTGCRRVLTPYVLDDEFHKYNYNSKLDAILKISVETVEHIYSVFKVLQKKYRLQMDNQRTELILKTCVCLHNYLRNCNSARNIYMARQESNEPSSWSRNISPKNWEECDATDVDNIRKEFLKYFS